MTRMRFASIRKILAETPVERVAQKLGVFVRFVSEILERERLQAAEEKYAEATADLGRAARKAASAVEWKSRWW